MEGLLVTILLVLAIVAIVKASQQASAKAGKSRPHVTHSRPAPPPLPGASQKEGDGTVRLASRLAEQTTSQDPALRSRARQALWRLQQRLRPERPDSRSGGPGPGSSDLGPGSGATGPHPEAAVPPSAPVHTHTHAPASPPRLRDVPLPPPRRPAPPPAAPRPEAGAPAEAPAAPTGWDLVAALEAVRAMPRFSPARKERVEGLLGGTAHFVLVVEGVQRSTGAEGDWAEGRMATGTVRGSTLPAGVRLPAATSAEAEGWSRGREVEVRVRLAAWDAIFDRPVFEGRLA